MVDVDIDEILNRMIGAIGGKTQADLGKALGVAQASISDAKRKKKVPPEWFLKLCTGRGLNPNWLLTGDGPVVIPKEDVRPFDVNLLKKVIEIVERRLKGKEPALSLEKKAELISIIYEDVLRDESLKDQLEPKAQRLLKLING